MARQWGDPDYRFLIMEHPIANLPDDLLQQRAETIVGQVVELLLTDPIELRKAA
jgi:hypothetical protein